jgi:nucleoside-diphosphate-sugar epimerase
MQNGGDTILVIGSAGQIGTELVLELRKQLGNDKVIASDIRNANDEVMNRGPFEQLDILNKDQLLTIVQKHNVSQIYLLAALLSATAEQKPMFAWQLNMDGLFNVLNLAKEGHIKKVFWPSSIAVFGPTTPRQNTPQYTIMEPNTVYGISKQAGERWCEYYHAKFGVDVRGVRYPGLISYKSPPGGGTTDYAVEIFHEALKNKQYTSFLGKDSTLPMMYMPDAIRATISVMDSEASQIKIRSSYNIAGISFSPEEIATEITKHIPGFVMSYEPDFRQAIADSWPQSIDDSTAQSDWGWQSEYNLSVMVEDMLKNLAN